MNTYKAPCHCHYCGNNWVKPLTYDEAHGGLPLVECPACKREVYANNIVICRGTQIA